MATRASSSKGSGADWDASPSQESTQQSLIKYLDLIEMYSSFIEGELDSESSDVYPSEDDSDSDSDRDMEEGDQHDDSFNGGFDQRHAMQQQFQQHNFSTVSEAAEWSHAAASQDASGLQSPEKSNAWDLVKQLTVPSTSESGNVFAYEMSVDALEEYSSNEQSLSLSRQSMQAMDTLNDISEDTLARSESMPAAATKTHSSNNTRPLPSLPQPRAAETSATDSSTSAMSRGQSQPSAYHRCNSAPPYKFREQQPETDVASDSDPEDSDRHMSPTSPGLSFSQHHLMGMSFAHSRARSDGQEHINKFLEAFKALKALSEMPSSDTMPEKFIDMATQVTRQLRPMVEKLNTRRLNQLHRRTALHAALEEQERKENQPRQRSRSLTNEVLVSDLKAGQTHASTTDEPTGPRQANSSLTYSSTALLGLSTSPSRGSPASNAAQFSPDGQARRTAVRGKRRLKKNSKRSSASSTSSTSSSARAQTARRQSATMSSISPSPDRTKGAQSHTPPAKTAVKRKAPQRSNSLPAARPKPSSTSSTGTPLRRSQRRSQQEATEYRETALLEQRRQLKEKRQQRHAEARRRKKQLEREEEKKRRRLERQLESKYKKMEMLDVRPVDQASTQTNRMIHRFKRMLRENYHEAVVDERQDDLVRDMIQQIQHKCRT